jgi:hypothetical protein
MLLRKFVALGDRLGDGPPVRKPTRSIGCVDLPDEILELMKNPKGFAQEVIGILVRLISLLNDRIAANTLTERFKLLLGVRTQDKSFSKFHDPRMARAQHTVNEIRQRKPSQSDLSDDN